MTNRICEVLLGLLLGFAFLFVMAYRSYSDQSGEDVVSSALQERIVLLGDQLRISILRRYAHSLGVGIEETHHHYSVRAPERIYLTPKATATASQMASQTFSSAHCAIVMDATEGPVREIREHVLIARQAGVDSVSVILARIRGMDDDHVGLLDIFDANMARTLIERQEREIREIMLFYNPEVSYQICRDDAAGGLFDCLRSIPDVGHLLVAGREAKAISAQDFVVSVYSLTKPEAPESRPILNQQSIKMWIGGAELLPVARTLDPINPGDNARLTLSFQNPQTFASGQRFLLEREGRLVAAGVIESAASESETPGPD